MRLRRRRPRRRGPPDRCLRLTYPQILKPYRQIREDLDGGAYTCCQLVEDSLETIGRDNPTMNAFLEVFDQEARVRARHVDRKLKAGKAGRLAGLLVGIKDLFCYQGHRLTCASKILEGFRSLITATAVQRLLEQDAIVVGRQNCDEFGMGSSTENSRYGPVKNPVDPQRVAGGSSGGSACAVARNMCQVALGSDTGGSVRQPASFCGVVGLKPTYSRISRYGLVAYSSSFDCVGILTRSVDDAAEVLSFVSGHDPRDFTSSKMPVPDFSQHQKGTFRIAVLREVMEAENIGQQVARSYQQMQENLARQGHSIEVVSFPYLAHLLPICYIITSAEASSNLARYDGMQFHRRLGGEGTLSSTIRTSRSNGFGKEIINRIMLGTFVLSSSYYESFYKMAQKARTLVKAHTESILDRHDFILVPSTAFQFGSRSKDSIKMYLSDLLTAQASIAGVPAISIPAGKDSRGLPVGMQLLGRPFQEQDLLCISRNAWQR